MPHRLTRCVATTVLVQMALWTAADQPNIVLLLADDLGFSDLGSYGSEISTPNLDAFAARGVRFSSYHTAPSCAPTRAMLMAGVDSHRAGVANMPESIPGSQAGRPGYAGVLGKNVRTIAEYLRQAGYHTYMAGKWHLGKSPDALPSARGFERTLVLADTGADNWEKKPYLPTYSHANWFANGRETELPADFYSSKTFIDRTIEFIEADRGDDRPFFAYVAFQAVHIPVQAPPEFTRKYLETYKDGWHALRRRRYEGAIARGVVPPDLALAEMPTTADWSTLTADEQRYEAKTMAVYAGMVDAMDHHIGRLVSYLKSIDEHDDTVFIFVSDNGAEPTDILQAHTAGLGTAYFNWWLERSGYNTDYETLGERHSYNMIGPSFASAAVSPLSYYKFFTGEGGMRVPMIIAGVETPLAGEVVDAFTWVTDLLPTMLRIAGVRPDRADGMIPPEGKDLTPLITAAKTEVRSPDETTGIELGGNAALFRGDFKIVRNRNPVGDDAWHLFDIRRDPAESRDLAAAEPKRLAAMVDAYAAYERAYGILPVPEDYDQREQVTLNALKERVVKPALMTFVGLLLAVFTYFAWRRRRRSVT